MDGAGRPPGGRLANGGNVGPGIEAAGTPSGDQAVSGSNDGVAASLDPLSRHLERLQRGRRFGPPSGGGLTP